MEIGQRSIEDLPHDSGDPVGIEPEFGIQFRYSTMVDESIGDTEQANIGVLAGRRKVLQNRAAEPTSHHIIFDGNDAIESFRNIVKHRSIDWFDESHIDDLATDSFAVKNIRSGHGRADHSANSEQRDMFPAPKNLSLAHRDKIKAGLHSSTSAIRPRVAQRYGTPLMPDGSPEHVAQFVFILRAHDHHFRDHPQVGEIKDAMVRWTVGPDDATAVEGKHHVQMLQCNIVDDLVYRPLKE